VAIVGGAAVDGVEPAARAPVELAVRDPHAGVDHVRGHAGAVRRIRVGVVERQRALVDPVQSPRRGGLGRVDRDASVLLDVRDARVERGRDRL
jgi:hypothetical protein